MGLFETLQEAAPNEIYNLTARYNADTHPHKANLGVGAYKTDNGEPFLFEAVRKAEEALLAERSNHEYLPIAGLPAFATAARDLLFGASLPAVKEGRVVSVQAVSGTGALRLCSDFLARHLPSIPCVLISDPTWENHVKIFSDSGLGKAIREYRYYHKETRGVDMVGMMEDLEAAPDGSVLLLHTCAHNPTGVDLSQSQWRELLEMVKRKRFFPLFDTAYQGFVTGDFDLDGWSLRLFAAEGLQLMACQSFSKNMGLYGERCGAFHLIAHSQQEAKAVRSNLELIIRPMYSSPPKHGAAVAAKVLCTPPLTALWREELLAVTRRIESMRKALYAALKEMGTPGSWDHVLQQRGMFTYTGLSRQQSVAMVEDHHVYMLASGRISVAGLTTGNVRYVAAAIHDVVAKYP